MVPGMVQEVINNFVINSQTVSMIMMNRVIYCNIPCNKLEKMQMCFF